MGKTLESEVLLKGNVFLAWQNQSTLDEWAKTGGCKIISFTRPIALSGQNPDRIDFEESMSAVGENPASVSFYLLAVDKAAEIISLEEGFFEKVAHNMARPSQGVTLFLEGEEDIRKWIDKVTVKDKDEKGKSTELCKVVVGSYLLLPNGELKLTIDSPYEPMLRVCTGQ